MNINNIKFPDVSKVAGDSPYTALETDNTIRIDCTAGNFTLNLPTAAPYGKNYFIIRTDILTSTNILTIDASSTQTIDGNLTYILFAGEEVILRSDGANWLSFARSSVDIQSVLAKGATADRRYLAGNLPGSQCVVGNATTGPSLNFLRAFPFIVSKTTKFDLISLWVSTVSTAGGQARLGIYRDNGNMYPGALIYDSGAIATDSGTGFKDQTITSSLQIFQPGVYWAAAEYGTATPLVKVFNSITGLYSFGYDNTISLSGAFWTYNVAHTFGALPDPYTAGATIQGGTPSLGTGYTAIFLRAI